MHFKANRIWPNSTVFILGGGPSLDFADVEKLKGKHVIATNNAFLLAPWAEVCFFMDWHWAKFYVKDLENFHGLKITVSGEAANKLKGIWFLIRGRPEGLTLDRHRLNTGLNSGHCAINLAIHFGAEKIILLGFDMRIRDGQHNWHNEHERNVKANIYEESYIPNMESLIPHLNKLNISVLNTTRGSALKCFPETTLEEHL